MSTTVDIILPAEQLEGTSATFSAWLIKPGEAVSEGQPVAELETDKVSMEICAPATGTLTETLAQVGEKVETDVVLGRIAPRTAAETAQSKATVPAFSSSGQASSESSSSEKDKPTAVQDAPVSEQQDDTQFQQDNSARHLLSPAVRRLLKQHQLNIEIIEGTGHRGRVTRNDVLAYLKAPDSHTIRPDIASKKSPLSSDGPRLSRPLQGNRIPHSNMRKSIANHMVDSLMNISPHVTSVFEMDMSNIIEHRKWHKKEYQELGVKLTFTAYFLAAMVKAVQKVPQTNARFHEDALEIFDDVNIGVGTALGDEGLVVPVVEQVQSMNLFEIAQALNEQTLKARDGKLKPSDMKNGSITISNHGVSGSLFASPIIINQPQVAIAGIGKLEKRVKVVEVNGEDTMQIKPMCYVSLSIDHRALDAHQTNLWLSTFVETIENWGQ